jgi:hypothetical protein
VPVIGTSPNCVSIQWDDRDTPEAILQTTCGTSEGMGRRNDYRGAGIAHAKAEDEAVYLGRTSDQRRLEDACGCGCI